LFIDEKEKDRGSMGCGIRGSVSMGFSSMTRPSVMGGVAVGVVGVGPVIQCGYKGIRIGILSSSISILIIILS
jgi:hypothetical protein